MNLHPPFADCTKAVALKGSISYRKNVAELLWTSATIVTKSPELEKGSLKAMGVLVETPTALVVASLEHVFRAACLTQLLISLSQQHSSPCTVTQNPPVLGWPHSVGSRGQGGFCPSAPFR